MTLKTATTEPAAETPSEFCDCYRNGDQWNCQSRDSAGYPRACQPGSGLTCSLKATVTATGRDDWARVDVKELRPCPCGRPKR